MVQVVVIPRHRFLQTKTRNLLSQHGMVLNAVPWGAATASLRPPKSVQTFTDITRQCKRTSGPGRQKRN